MLDKTSSEALALLDAPDLAKPSLTGLAWLLRHPERWPEGFKWHYSCVRTCALGLAVHVWGDTEKARRSGWGSAGLRILGLPSPTFFPFYGMSNGSAPGDVANKIDDYFNRT